MIPTSMLGSLRTLVYIAASILFILSLRGLSKQRTARRGNAYGAVGMALAVLITAVALFDRGFAAAAVHASPTLPLAMLRRCHRRRPPSSAASSRLASR